MPIPMATPDSKLFGRCRKISQSGSPAVRRRFSIKRSLKGCPGSIFRNSPPSPCAKMLKAASCSAAGKGHSCDLPEAFYRGL